MMIFKPCFLILAWQLREGSQWSLTAYEDDNTTVSFKWYGYIVTDLVEFEDVSLVHRLSGSNICHRWFRLAKNIGLQKRSWTLQRAGYSCATYFKLP
jgi:hypothetical protein